MGLRIGVGVEGRGGPSFRDLSIVGQGYSVTLCCVDRLASDNSRHHGQVRGHSSHVIKTK